jgi:hypothetical protein
MKNHIRSILLFLMLAAALLLTACSKPAATTPVVSAETPASGVSSEPSHSEPAGTTNSVVSSEPSHAEPASTPSASNGIVTLTEVPTPAVNGYSFKFNGGSVILGMSMKELIGAIGEPQKIFESPSCAFAGVDKILYYPGFTLTTFPVEGSDFILSAVFSDDSITTDKGIFLGSTTAEAEAAYGTPTRTEGTGVFYEKDGMWLRFIYENGVVADITYYFNVVE